MEMKKEEKRMAAMTDAFEVAKRHVEEQVLMQPLNLVNRFVAAGYGSQRPKLCCQRDLGQNRSNHGENEF